MLYEVITGTLNYIFNTISAEIPLSKTIQLAKEEGYSEPDPRIDLSGIDVVRKLLILVRESGYKIEKGDVTINKFIPDQYFDGSIEDFWANIAEVDADFEKRRQVLEAENKCWRFVAKYENGQSEVGLQEVAQGHSYNFV